MFTFAHRLFVIAKIAADWFALALWPNQGKFFESSYIYWLVWLFVYLYIIYLYIVYCILLYDLSGSPLSA